MNCKPGDLAVIVQSDFPESIGMLCLVTRHGEFGEDGIWEWFCRTNSKSEWQDWDDESGRTVYSRNGYIPDAWLRPIRDPGDDATDETLEWRPVPHKETA